jgi:hypothetical protein
MQSAQQSLNLLLLLEELLPLSLIRRHKGTIALHLQQISPRQIHCGHNPDS